jgi:hypothetical protein
MNGPVTITSILEAASDYDLIDLQTVKDDLGLAASTDDAYLQRRIDEISIAARQYMNRTIQMETVRDEFWAQREAYPWQLPGGAMPLQLSRWPVVGMTARSSLAAPPAPVLSQTAGGASSAPQTLFAVITYLTVEGETLPSPEASLTVGAGFLLTIAPPPPAADYIGNPAIGWNAYVGAAAGAEALQNGQAFLPMGAPFTFSGTPATAVVAPPPATVVSENGRVLVEGADYLVNVKHAQLTRLFTGDLYPTRWSTLPITVQYAAGYPIVPPDISGAVSRAVKGLYMGRLRDPAIKSQSAVGIYSASYIAAAGTAGGVLTPDVYGVLDGYRVPVIA